MSDISLWVSCCVESRLFAGAKNAIIMSDPLAWAIRRCEKVNKFGSSASLAATWLLAAAVPAAAVTWTFVQDVLIEENQGNPAEVRITGSFDYDSTTQTFSNIVLTVTNTGPFDNNNVASLT